MSKEKKRSKLWQSKTTGHERSRPVSDGKIVM
jgi:hypothetical protein